MKKRNDMDSKSRSQRSGAGHEIEFHWQIWKGIGIILASSDDWVFLPFLEDNRISSFGHAAVTTSFSCQMFSIDLQ